MARLWQLNFGAKAQTQFMKVLDAMVNLGSLPEVYMTFTVCEFISLVKLC